MIPITPGETAPNPPEWNPAAFLMNRPGFRRLLFNAGGCDLVPVGLPQLCGLYGLAAAVPPTEKILRIALLCVVQR